MAADLLGLLVAFTVAELLFPARTAFDRFGPEAEILVFLATLPAWVVMARLYGLYSRDEERNYHTTVDDLVGIFHLVTVGAWGFFTAAWLSHAASPNVTKLLAFWVLAIVLVTSGRASARVVCRRRDSYVQNAVIVGAGDVGQAIARKFAQHPEYRVKVLGFVDDRPKERHADVRAYPVLGGTDSLNAIVGALDVDRVIVAFSNDPHEETLNLVRELNEYYIQVDIVPRLFEIVGTSTTMHSVEGIPLIGLPASQLSRSSRMLKRAMDVAVASTLLVALSPILALIAIAVKLDSRGPVLFRQSRMGFGDRTFTMLKFRTMFDGADERKRALAHLNRHARAGGDPRMFKIPEDPRVTRVGRTLRRYALDELPQLLNVVLGHMSLVGPRPLVVDEDRHVSGWARRRLSLKPGMTGLWQVLGRSAISFEEMVGLDYVYVTTWSLWNDIRLLGRTIPVVLGGNGEPVDVAPRLDDAMLERIRVQVESDG